VPRDEKLTLAHPLVREAKARWDKSRKFHYRAKRGPGFQTYFELFRDHPDTQYIIKRTGRTRQCINHIYRTYFRKMFDDKTLGNRKAEIAFKQSEKDFLAQHPFLEKLLEKARAAACVAALAHHHIHGHPVSALFSHRISVNGKMCSVHHMTRCTTFQGGKRFFAHVTVMYSTLASVHTHIFHVEVRGFPEHTFIVPATVIRKAHPSIQTRGRVTLYLPMEKLPIPAWRPPLIDYWKYLDAWPEDQKI